MQAVYSTSALRQAIATHFKSLTRKLDSGILKALDKMQYEYMTPVQEEVLSSLPTLQTDCLVHAKTGTGKTTAFLLPALQSLVTSDPIPKGQVAILILSPTRELAMQIAKECDQITACLRKPVHCHTAYGGSARASTFQSFINGSPAVLVATPGRLNDYLRGGARAKFDNLRTLILDEADVMLKRGFLPHIKRILGALPPKTSGWQGMCFSATVPEQIKGVLELVLKPGYTSISTIDETEPPTPSRVPEYHVLIPTVKDTFRALLSLVQHEVKEGGPSPKIIVFGATARQVALYAEFFRQVSPFDIYELQSRLTQPRRIKTTQAFKEATKGVMFATDVIGRGMDFPNVTSVIQVGLPLNREQYIHRVGRTARMDKDGRAVILLTKAESFFLKYNPDLPIRPYVHALDMTENTVSSQAMAAIDEGIKQKAYVAYLGFMMGSMGELRLSREELVATANELAIEGLHCAEPPLVKMNRLRKMGLAGVKGIRCGSEEEGNVFDRTLISNSDQMVVHNHDANIRK